MNSNTTKTNTLFAPLELGAVSLRNRIVIAPTTRMRAKTTNSLSVHTLFLACGRRSARSDAANHLSDVPGSMRWAADSWRPVADTSRPTSPRPNGGMLW